jgi:hypothetical protein
MSIRAFANDAVPIESTFITSHAPQSHSARIGNRLFGPYRTEIELVRALPVNLRDCELMETRDIDNAQFRCSHKWKRLR